MPQLGAGGSVTGQDGQGRLLYRTGAGDTPAGIASRYGVPLYALRIANLNLLTGGEWIPPAGTTVTIPNPHAPTEPGLCGHGLGTVETGRRGRGQRKSLRNRLVPEAFPRVADEGFEPP